MLSIKKEVVLPLVILLLSVASLPLFGHLKGITGFAINEECVLFEDNFESGAGKWSFMGYQGQPLIFGSKWNIVNMGETNALKGIGHNWATLAEPQNWKDFIFTFKTKLVSNGVHINFKLNGPERYFLGFNQEGLYLNKNGGEAILANSNTPYNLSQWYNFKIIAEGNNIKIYVNDELKIDYYDLSAIQAGSIGFETLDGEFYFDDVIVKGPCPAASCGNGIVDSGEECDDGNTNNYNDGCLSTCKKCAAPGLRADIYGGSNRQCCEGLQLMGGVCNVPPDNQPVCRNGLCESGETADNCPEDCFVANELPFIIQAENSLGNGWENGVVIYDAVNNPEIAQWEGDCDVMPESLTENAIDSIELRDANNPYHLMIRGSSTPKGNGETGSNTVTIKSPIDGVFYILAKYYVTGRHEMFQHPFGRELNGGLYDSQGNQIPNLILSSYQRANLLQFVDEGFIALGEWKIQKDRDYILKYEANGFGGVSIIEEGEERIGKITDLGGYKPESIVTIDYFVLVPRLNFDNHEAVILPFSPGTSAEGDWSYGWPKVCTPTSVVAEEPGKTSKIETEIPFDSAYAVYFDAWHSQREAPTISLTLENNNRLESKEIKLSTDQDLWQAYELGYFSLTKGKMAISFSSSSGNAEEPTAVGEFIFIPQSNILQQESSQDCMCPAIYSPVCGIDEKTYSNGCVAECSNIPIMCRQECPCEGIVTPPDITLYGSKCLNGCVYQDNCITFGIRVDTKYCDIDSELKDQKSKGSCSNSFECRSNLCIDNDCVIPGLWKKFVAWMRKFFRG